MQSTKVDPLADSTSRTWAHVAQSPAFRLEKLIFSAPSGFDLLESSAIGVAANNNHFSRRYGFEVAGAAAPLSGAAGFAKSASGKFTFSSILSITSFCVRSVAELPESISNANFKPLTSR